MSELTLTLLRLGLLALLWIFIFSVVGGAAHRHLRHGGEPTRQAQGAQARPRSRTARRTSPRTPVPAAAGAGAAGAGVAGAAGAAAAGPPRAPRARGAAAARAPRPPSSSPRGPLTGTSLPLRSGGILIGRNPECALVLDDDYASGRHCRIYPDPSGRDGWVVEDLGSTNGTFIGRDAPDRRRDPSRSAPPCGSARPSSNCEADPVAIALRYAARSDLGLGPKSRNEDSGYAGPNLLVLADGMGGHAAGDVASSMIVGELAPLDEEDVTADQAIPLLEEALHSRERQADQGDARERRPRRHGQHDDRHAPHRQQARHGPHRRLPRVHAPRRHVLADHEGPLLRPAAHRRGPHLQGGRRPPPAALRRHARHDRPARRRARHLAARGQDRRPLPACAPTACPTSSAPTSSRRSCARRARPPRPPTAASRSPSRRAPATT